MIQIVDEHTDWSGTGSEWPVLFSQTKNPVRNQIAWKKCLPKCKPVTAVVNYCFTSLFGTNGQLSVIVIRSKQCIPLK